jgi:hypothetical protein
MVNNHISERVFGTLILAAALFVCFIAFFMLFIMVGFATDPGMDAGIMTAELLLSAVWLGVVSAALYAIYKWCLLFFPNQLLLLRSWMGTLYVVLVTAAAITTLYFPLAVGLMELERPASFWLVPYLLRAGFALELLAVAWAVYSVVRLWLQARSAPWILLGGVDGH